MANPKTKVVKSKSSNSAITTKPEGKNKKTRSNAELPPHAIKKRGVYVEKKSILAINVQGPKLHKHQTMIPRQRPGKKRFLASVLTILSKTTIATQYPDNGMGKNGKIKRKAKKNGTNKIEVVGTEVGTVNNVNAKKRFKSRVLNGKPDEELVVLQSKKEMLNTPSLYSEGSREEILQLSDLPKLVKDEDTTKNDLEISIYNSIPIAGVAKEVWEGKKAKKEKHVKIENDPVTLVSDLPKKDEKGLYNFFVDLLETTFSVYNVKAQYSAAPDVSTDISTSRVAFEIDESVAKKLKVCQCGSTDVYDEVTLKPSKNCYYIKSDDAPERDDQNLEERFQSKPVPIKPQVPRTTKRRKLRTKSFNYVKGDKVTSKTQSAVLIQKKSFSRNNKKKNLLNLLKEQLKSDFNTFEEPQNLYQALRVMARNKRKCKKSISFQTENYNNECMFKRRKLISAKASAKYKPESELLRSMRGVTASEMSASRKNFKSDASDYESISRHSLEVYGFDYEMEASRKNAVVQDKEVVFTYHSSPSVSD